MCQDASGGRNQVLFEEGVSTWFAAQCPDPGAPKASPGMWAWGGEAVVIKAAKGQCQGGRCLYRLGQAGRVRVSQAPGDRREAPGFAADPTLPRVQRTERRAPKKMGSSAMSRRLP